MLYAADLELAAADLVHLIAYSSITIASPFNVLVFTLIMSTLYNAWRSKWRIIKADLGLLDFSMWPRLCGYTSLKCILTDGYLCRVVCAA